MIWPLSKELYQQIFEEEIGIGVFNASGRLENHNENLRAFLLNPSSSPLLNRSMLGLFPELIGHEQILEDMREQQHIEIFLERVFRLNLRGKTG